MLAVTFCYELNWDNFGLFLRTASNWLILFVLTLVSSEFSDVWDLYEIVSETATVDSARSAWLGTLLSESKRSLAIDIDVFFFEYKADTLMSIFVFICDRGWTMSACSWKIEVLFITFRFKPFCFWLRRTLDGSYPSLTIYKAKPVLICNDLSKSGFTLLFLSCKSKLLFSKRLFSIAFWTWLEGWLTGCLLFLRKDPDCLV